MKKILIAIDYSPSAEKVAEIGYAFGKPMNAEITLLHVVIDPVYYSSMEYSPIMGYGGFNIPDPIQIIDNEGLKAEAQKFLQTSKQHLGDNNIKTLVASGDCAEAILKTAKQISADVIVMGSHGRSGLEKILMGSIAEKVLHDTTIPLFVVPTGEGKK